MSFNAGNITSELHLDRSPFIRSLRDARREAANFVRKTYEATLGVDTDDARRTIASLKRQMESVSESVGLGADTTKARRQIADLARYAQSIRADVKVGANIASLKTAREQVRQILGSIDGSEAKAIVTAEARGFDSAERQTGSLQRDMTKLNGTTARMQAQVDGVRGVLRRLSRVDEKMDNLQGRTARMGVAVAGGAAAGLILSQVTNQFDLISQSMTALGKVKMPLIYAAFGGLPGIIAPVSAALVGLVGQLSAGALGFVAIGGAAAGGATAGLYAYTAAAKAAAGGAMLVREETRKGANEQLAQKRISILNTAAARSFNLELDKQVIALTKVQATLGNKMLPAYTRMLDLFRSTLPALTPPLYRLVDGVTAIGESFVSAVLKGQGLGQLQSVLNFVATSGIKAAQAISDMARVGLAGIQPIIPAATRLLNKITGLSGGALKFVQSSRGMGVITTVVAQIEQKMYAVLRVIGSLSVGLYNLGAAFAPIGSTMLADLGRLTQKFADLTAKGSGFRQEVSNLNTAGIPIIRSLSSVVGALFTQFGRVANAAMNLRMEGTKTRVLVAIFNALRDAATPVASALIRAFSTLGPLIPPLIAQFAELFNNFTAQAPLIGRYVRLLTTLMGIFNRLPPSVQGGIAQIAAFNAIMGPTGMSIAGAAGGLIGFVTHLSLLRAVQGKATVGQIMLNKSTYAGAAAWVRATAVSVAHRAALVATTVATKAARVAQTALNWAMRANPIGLLITAAAALAVGFVLLYRRSETFRNIIQSVGRFIKTVAVGAFRALVSAAKSVWTWFQKLPGPVQALISPLGFVIANFRRLRQSATAAVQGVLRGLGSLTSGASRLMEIGRKTAEGFLSGFRQVPIIAKILNVLQRLFGQSRTKTDSQGWRGIGASSAGKVLRGFAAGGLVGGAVALFSQFFNRSRNTSSGKPWNGIGGGAASRVLQGFKRGGLIGGAAALIGQFFGRSSGTSKGKPWNGIGSGAVGRVLQGFRRGGLVGGAVALIGQFFGRSSGTSRSRPWNGIGSGAVGRVLQGFRSGGLIGGAVALIGQFFGRSSGTSGGRNWNGIGSGAVSRVLRGFQSGGLVGGAVSIINNFFGKSSSSSNSKNWNGIGSGAVGRVAAGFQAGGLPGAAAAVVAEARGRANSESNGPGWRTAGANAIQGVINGVKSKAGALYNAVRSIAGGFLRSFRRRMRERSPSKEMEDSGGRAVAGLANGLLKARRSATVAAQALGSDLLASVQKGITGLRVLGRVAEVTGRDLVTGLANGAMRAESIVTRAMQRIASSALRAARARLKVRSPSKEMQGIGGQAGEGLARGIESSVRRIGKGGAAAAEALVGSVRSGIAALRGLRVAAAVAGRALSEGLASGALRARAAVVRAMRGIAHSALAAAKATLGVRSPSREMFGIGNNVVLGLVNGLLSGRFRAENAAASLTQSALRGARRGMAPARLDMPIRPHLSAGVSKLSPAVVGGQAQARAQSARMQQTVTHKLAASSEDQARAFREEIGALRKDNERLATRNVEMAKVLTRTDFFRTAVDEAVYKAAQAESRRRNGGK